MSRAWCVGVVVLLAAGCTQTVPVYPEPAPIVWDDTWALRAQPNAAQIEALEASIEARIQQAQEQIERADSTFERKVWRRQIDDLEAELQRLAT